MSEAAQPTTIDVLMKELTDVGETLKNKVDAKVKPLGEEIARMGKAIEAVQAETRELRAENGALLMHDKDLTVRTGKFAGYHAADLLIADSVLRSHRKPEIGEARSALKKAIDPDYISAWETQAVKALTWGGQTPQAQQKAKAQVANWSNAMRAEWRKTKALDSTTATAGDELVPTLEAANLWMDVNLNTTILPTLRQVAMPSNPYDWPVQFGDVNWYPISENIQVTTTTPATAKRILTAYGLKTGVPFSDELNEDAVIALVPELRAALGRNAAEVVDDVLFNADTTATNGINSDGTTITTSTAGSAHWLLGFDGIRHLPLVTAASTLRVDRNGAVTAADVYNRAMRAIGKYAAAQVLGDTVFFADVNTVIASLTLDECESIQNFGPRATISSGELARIYGAPIVVSGQFRLADTDGKVTAAGNVTNTGNVLCTNVSQWAVGFRRGITFETDREPGKGQTTLYVSFRVALQDRTGGAATATHTSIVYDITGVV